MRIVLLFLFLLLILVSEKTMAQDSAKVIDKNDTLKASKKDAKDSLIALEQLIVTATRTARRLSETPASVTLITKEDIESAPARDINDLLIFTKGIVVKRTAGMGEGIPGDINMRGIPGSIAASRSLVMVDGIPTNASGTPFLILNEIPLESIERIEVVRGPFSCLYGANAFGGVVNIITKTSFEKPRHEVYGDLGNMAYWQVGGLSGGGTDFLSYHVNGGMRDVGNFLGRDKALIRRGNTMVYKDSANHFYWDRRLFGKTEIFITENTSVSLNGRYFQSRLGFGRTRDRSGNVEEETAGRKILFAPFLNMSLTPNIDIKVGGYGRQVKGEFLSDAIDVVDTVEVWVPSLWEAVSNDFQVQAQASARLGNHQIITAGFETMWNNIDFGATLDRYTREPVAGSESVQESINNTGMFVQDEISFFRRWLVIPGIRFDKHSLFGWAVSPKVGSSFKLHESVGLHSSFGRGFRAPALSELYLTPLRVISFAVMIANPDLKPEYIWAVDGGVNVDLFKMVFFSIDGFYNWLEDLIAPRFAGFGEGTEITGRTSEITHSNIRKAWSAGIETDIEVRPLKWIALFGNYTFTRSKDEDTVQAWTENRYTPEEYQDRPKGTLDYIPLHKFNFGLQVRKVIHDFRLEGTVSEGFMGERSYLEWGYDWDNVVLNELDKARPKRVFLKSYWRTDLSLKCTFKNFVWIGFTGQNLTDAEFEESGGTFAPGRMFYVRLGVGF
jgi:outer membrane cobalamin receptor